MRNEESVSALRAGLYRDYTGPRGHGDGTAFKAVLLTSEEADFAAMFYVASESKSKQRKQKRKGNNAVLPSSKGKF